MILSILLAVATPVVQFDYLGTFNGEAQLRGNCSKTTAQEIRCQFTEVRPTPLERVTDEYAEVKLALPSYREAKANERKEKNLPPIPLTFQDVPHLELRAFWKTWWESELLKEPTTFESQKFHECNLDPRDFFALRAAYNESYDDFLDHAKLLQGMLCKAKSPADFTRAKIERWDLITNTCALNYAHYVQKLKSEGENTWEAMGPIQGPKPITECYTEMKTRLNCQPKTGCRLSREYTGLKAAPPTTRFRGKDVPPKCQGKQVKLEQVFEASHADKKPQECKFFLDRERASYCCAYQ